MAEWRNRGYVADSDEEEEESQRFLQLGAATAPEANSNCYEDQHDLSIDKCNEGLGREEAAPEEINDGIEENKSDAKEGGITTCRAPPKPDESKAQGRIPSKQGLKEGHHGEESNIGTQEPSGHLGGGRSLSYESEANTIQDDGDIDELQEDHYRDSTAAYLMSGFVTPNRDVASLDLSNASSKPQRLPSPSSVSPSLPHGLQISQSVRIMVDESPKSRGGVTPVEDKQRRLASSPYVLIRSPADKNSKYRKATRTLRHRNPIQLHPYAIESEKYRQDLKARGVRPLRIAQLEADAASARREESQNIEYNGEESQDPDRSNGLDLFKSPSSSPIHDQELSTEPASNQTDIFVFGDDDLPDTNALFAKKPGKYIANGHKRRRVAPASFRMPAQIRKEIQGSKPNASLNLPSDDDGHLNNIPPSPPHSGNGSPLERDWTSRPVSLPPQKVSEITLRTPLTSSEPRRSHKLDISDTELTEKSFQDSSESLSSSDESGTDGETIPDKGSYQLQRVQRKIRGVLPASWLKLDVKGQQKRSGHDSKFKSNLLPGRSTSQRGVARPTHLESSRNLNVAASHNDAVLSSDTNDPNLGDVNLPQQQSVTRTIDLASLDDEGLFGDKLGEASENDRVDAMLPAAVRSRIHPHKTKKRQKKKAESDSSSRLKASAAADTAQSQRTLRMGIADQFDKGHKRKLRFRPPNMSILDAESLNRNPQEVVPSFLKVAARTVRSRRDRGKHSPSRKYLRLATQIDDADANETLSNWRDGNFASVAREGNNASQYRRPLQPRSANNASVSRAPQIGKGTSANRSLSVLKSARPQLTSTKQRNLQSSLDRLVKCQSNVEVEGGSKIRSLRKDEESKKRGQLVSSIRANHESRPAMLETSGGDEDKQNAQNMFQRDLSRINNFDDDSGLPNVLRLFNDTRREAYDGEHSRRQSQTRESCITKGKTIARKPVVHRTRKLQPRQIDVSNLWSRASSAPVAVDAFPDENPPTAVRHSSSRAIVTGLGPFGTRYSDNFNITTLPIGTCFREVTFIGSGSFARSMMLTDTSCLDSSRGYALLQIGSDSRRWGPWNDAVSTELGEDVARISQALSEPSVICQSHISTSAGENAVSVLKGIITYFSQHLSFLDPIDRLSFVQRCKIIVSTLLNDFDGGNLWHKIKDQEVLRSSHLTLSLKSYTMTLVLANQVRQISKHELVPLKLQDEAESLVQVVAQRTMSLAMTEGFRDFEMCISQMKMPDAVGYTVQDKNSAIEAFVVTHHVISQASASISDFWRLVQFEIPVTNADYAFDVRLPELSWKRLFTLLPFLEFDVNGLLEIGRRFHVAFDNWALVKALTNPVLVSALANPRGQDSSFNTYCRVLFRRCLHLISGWGWHHCESIIGTLFDYFARNKLGHLRNEESHGSPLFLEHLAEKPSLIAEPEERCFHILLKIIGSGIQHMRPFSTEKKIRDIVWRLMPNHGRSHPKEEAIHQADLDALRNHHDLLCTLYWASPTSCRPRVTVIRNLVNLEQSHREACHIHIRAWFNLVRFQLSTDEPIDSLCPFAEWHDDLLVQILRQHNLARTEAEDQVRSAQHNGGLAISHELYELTIVKNQRQVEGVLSDALISLKIAIDKARDSEAAAVMLSITLAKVFELFGDGGLQSDRIVTQALDILSAFTNKSMTCLGLCARDGNDDSQDYGDWQIFEDDNIALVTTPKHEIDLRLQTFQEPLRHLLSNCFGSDAVPTDSLLSKIVEVWVASAQIMVRNGKKTWNDYIESFGHDSWSSLRSTEQTRKYAAYYFAILIERDLKIYSEHELFFLTSWVGSLVERESLLKFQHRFTGSLLDADSSSPLLKNLPFHINAGTSRYQISTTDFSERRLSLISSLLSNMRQSLENAVVDPAVNTAQLRQEYKDLLKHLMGTMKRNYQELGPSPKARGAYVNFVHRVIEFLQQHTSTICPIDRFFTDDGAFPLPATDPTYVVGQLKNYGLRLQDSKTPKQLAVFLQSVSERAAVDCQQTYLADQLYTAMSGPSGDDKSQQPTLRSLLIKAIIPAYVKLACTANGRDCGWIMTLPFLQALQRVFEKNLFDLDGTDPKSKKATASAITTFLNSIRISFRSLLSLANLREHIGILKFISACFTTITAVLPTLDYLSRLSGRCQQAIEDIGFFKVFAIRVAAESEGFHEEDVSELQGNEEQAYQDLLSFVTHELRNSMVRNWAYVRCDSQYYFTRGSSRREVVVDIGLYEKEKAHLSIVLKDFFECLGAMPALNDDDDAATMVRSKRVLDLDHLVF